MRSREGICSGLDWALVKGWRGFALLAVHSLTGSEELYCGEIYIYI